MSSAPPPAPHRVLIDALRLHRTQLQRVGGAAVRDDKGRDGGQRGKDTVGRDNAGRLQVVAVSVGADGHRDVGAGDDGAVDHGVAGGGRLDAQVAGAALAQRDGTHGGAGDDERRGAVGAAGLNGVKRHVAAHTVVA